MRNLWIFPKFPVVKPDFPVTLFRNPGGEGLDDVPAPRSVSSAGIHHESRLHRFYVAVRESGWERKVAILLGLAAILSGFATYAALKAMPPFGDDSDTIFWLLNLDLVILLALVSLIALRIVALWAGRRQGAAGSRLHVRLVLIFCFLAATPAILMTGFSAYFFHYGIQAWFSERVRTAVNESQAVAEAYLQEHHQVIRADVLAMANDLDRQATLLLANPGAFDRLMRTQSVLRNLSEAIVFDRSGRVLAESGLTFTLGFETVPDYALKSAEDGDVVLMTAGSDDRIRALVKLNNFFDSYLFVGRMVDPVVLSHLQDTRKAAEEYEDLQGRYSDLQVAATLIFFTVAFVILLAAVWFGLVFARQLVAPIGVLINASDRVRAGDLTARVPEAKTFDEFEYLARSFNRMTSQIQSQRDELVNANRQLDHRRRFTETILAGVSSGVAGIDNYGRITLVNSTVCELFQCEPSELSGRDICDLVPDLRPLLAAAHRRPSRIAQAEVPYALADGSRRTLLVRIAIEMIGEEDKGAVLTFDDITELLAAQRKAAWADVARRIAHEIKNPLTPIQLSAERLRRKYLRQIDEEPETFERCIETIIRHVGDIGRMVSEFSAFARMPEPIMKEENIVALIRDTVLFQQQAHASIRFRVAGDGALSPGIVCCCDASQFRQALTNLIQNSVDSIESVVAADPAHQGRVDVFVSSRGGNVYVVVSDNGAGLPKMDEVSRIAEPYVTMKEKGTGLGLAIVRKIMEDHGGRLIIGAPDWLRRSDEWTEPGGATIVLAMPVGHCEARGLDPLTSGEAA